MIFNRSYFKTNIDEDQTICLETKHEQTDKNNAEVSNQYQNQSVNDHEINEWLWNEY